VAASPVVPTRMDAPSRDRQTVPAVSVLRPAERPRLDAPPAHEFDRTKRWHQLGALAAQLQSLMAICKKADTAAKCRRSGQLLFAQAQAFSVMQELSAELDQIETDLTIELLDGALRERMIRDCRPKAKS
jgi:hypothetical protein